MYQNPTFYVHLSLTLENMGKNKKFNETNLLRDKKALYAQFYLSDALEQFVKCNQHSFLFEQKHYKVQLQPLTFLLITSVSFNLIPYAYLTSQFKFWVGADLSINFSIFYKKQNFPAKPKFQHRFSF